MRYEFSIIHVYMYVKAGSIVAIKENQKGFSCDFLQYLSACACAC